MAYGIGEKLTSFNFPAEDIPNPFRQGEIFDSQIEDSVEQIVDFMGYLSSPVKDENDPKIAALERLRYFGFDFDSQEFKTDVTEEAKALQELGVQGRIYVEISPDLVATDALHYLVESLKPDSVVESYADEDLFGKKDALTRVPKLLVTRYGDGLALPQDKAGNPRMAQVRLMPFNANQNTGVDPALLALKQPFDNYAREKWGEPTDQTQEEFFQAIRQHFAPENGDLLPGHLRSFESAIGQDRIAKVDARNQLFAQGWGRLLGVERVKAGDARWAAAVDSDGGQMKLDGGNGRAHDRGGVFGSMGKN